MKHIIAVASGKGGVGKSTTAVNLALGLKALGLRAGIVDADIYGPSQPRLLGVSGQPRVSQRQDHRAARRLGPQGHVHGLHGGRRHARRVARTHGRLGARTRCCAKPTGRARAALSTCSSIDMPPGTGDVQLTISQAIPLSGAVIVSTPQDLALIDARKGIGMFKRVEVPLLGIIENMSYFACPSCGTRSDIFGHGGAREEAMKLGVPFLGEVPLHMEIREKSDSGRPVVATDPEGIHAQIYREIAAKVWTEVERAKGTLTPPPVLDIVEDGRMLKAAFPDGRTFELPAEMLRVMSPSAEVQGHSPDQRVTVPRRRTCASRI